MAKLIEVSAGIVYRKPYILIAKRQSHLDKAGFWEFPGGKLEAGETPLEALKRELKEELNININIRTCSLLEVLEHQYPEKKVRLHFWEVFSYEGEPLGFEAQEIEWVLPNELANYSFLEANKPIIERLNFKPL